MQLDFRRATGEKPEPSQPKFTGFIYSATFGAATAFGAAGMHNTASQTGIPLRASRFILLLLGSALLSGLVGMLANYKPTPTSNSGRGIRWIWPLAYFLIGTAGTAFLFLQGRSTALSNRLLLFVFLLSFLSFGLAGSILGFCGLILQTLYWRWLHAVRWGLGFACALSIMIGISAGWAAYGWAIFSSQLLLSLGN